MSSPPPAAWPDNSREELSVELKRQMSEFLARVQVKRTESINLQKAYAEELKTVILAEVQARRTRDLAVARIEKARRERAAAPAQTEAAISAESDAARASWQSARDAAAGFTRRAALEQEESAHLATLLQLSAAERRALEADFARARLAQAALRAQLAATAAGAEAAATAATIKAATERAAAAARNRLALERSDETTARVELKQTLQHKPLRATPAERRWARYGVPAALAALLAAVYFIPRVLHPRPDAPLAQSAPGDAASAAPLSTTPAAPAPATAMATPAVTAAMTPAAMPGSTSASNPLAAPAAAAVTPLYAADTNARRDLKLTYALKSRSLKP